MTNNENVAVAVDVSVRTSYVNCGKLLVQLYQVSVVCYFYPHKGNFGHTTMWLCD